MFETSRFVTDFYVTSAGLVVQETTIGNSNGNLTTQVQAIYL